MLARAVTAITSRAENFNLTVSTALLSGDILTFLTDASKLPKLLEAPPKFKLLFSLSIVLRLV